MDPNTTLPILQPVADTIKNLMSLVSIFVGGIFGLYVIMFIWRIYSYKKSRAFYKKLRKDINKMNESFERLEKKVDSLKRSQKILQAKPAKASGKAPKKQK